MNYREALLVVAGAFRRLEVMAPKLRPGRLYDALVLSGAYVRTRGAAIAALRIAAFGEKEGSGLFHFLEKLTPQQIADLCEKAAK